MNNAAEWKKRFVALVAAQFMETPESLSLRKSADLNAKRKAYPGLDRQLADIACEAALAAAPQTDKAEG